MPKRKPSVIVIAGANGAGKSTAAPILLKGALKVGEFVNADVIARGLSAYNPEGVALAAGKMMLGRVKELAAHRERFAFETTLASRSFAPWIKSLTAEGYTFHLVFLWLPSADEAVARVAGRVKMGGHDVPEETMRRRYLGGLQNFFRLYQPLAKTWRMYDNSVGNLDLIAAGTHGREIEVRDETKWQTIKVSIQSGRDG